MKKVKQGKIFPLEWFASMIVLIILILIVVWFWGDRQTVKIKDDEVEVYFVGTKVQYPEGCRLSFDGEKTEVVGNKNNESVPLSYEPLIVNKGAKLINPSTLIYHTGDASKPLKKITYFSEITTEDEGNIAVKRENKTATCQGGFCYNGDNLYVFLEPVVLKVGGSEYDLAPLSFANAVYKEYVEIYSSASNEYSKISTVGDVKIEADFGEKYTIDLSTDLYKKGEDEYILFSAADTLDKLE